MEFSVLRVMSTIYSLSNSEEILLIQHVFAWNFGNLSCKEDEIYIELTSDIDGMKMINDAMMLLLLLLAV